MLLVVSRGTSPSGGHRSTALSQAGEVKDFVGLRVCIKSLGLDDRRLLSIMRESDSGRASPEIAYNVLVGPNGLRILAGDDRGGLVAWPSFDHRFPDEAAACEYVWRRIRSMAAPELLSDEERAALRHAARAILKH